MTEAEAKQQSFATLLVANTSKSADLISDIGIIQLNGLGHRFASGEVAPERLITATGMALAANFLILRSLGATESDIKELTAKSIQNLSNEYPTLFAKATSTDTEH